jgi:hypothetical protein
LIIQQTGAAGLLGISIIPWIYTSEFYEDILIESITVNVMSDHGYGPDATVSYVYKSVDVTLMKADHVTIHDLILIPSTSKGAREAHSLPLTIENC